MTNDQKTVEKAIARSNLEWLRGSLCFVTKHGSQAYGTSTPTSDTDYKGFCIPPKKYFYGFNSRFEQAEFKHAPDNSTPDMVIYDIRKFFKLAAECNPSIIEVLYTDPSSWVMYGDDFLEILDNRDLFLSKKAKFTFSGYAVAQLKKIKTHYRWLTNPPKAPPTRSEFKLPERTLVPADQLAAAEAAVRKVVESWTVNADESIDPATRMAIDDKYTQALLEQKITVENRWQVAAQSLGLEDNFIDLMTRERTYRAAMETWRAYQSWLANRNPARSELERKWGYDTKHGMHLVRLLRMGTEILEGKGVQVFRPDREELLAIRNGLWSYEQLLEWCGKMEANLDALYETSTLRKAPEVNRLEEMLVEIVEWANG